MDKSVINVDLGQKLHHTYIVKYNVLSSNLIELFVVKVKRYLFDSEFVRSTRTIVLEFLTNNCLFPVQW